MMFATGVEEAMRITEAFADPEDGAAYWAEGARAVETADLTYPGAAGQPQAARLYRGRGAGTVLYIHGGGWAGGSIALNERTCRHLASASGWDVVSVSYRLAPEHPFPHGLEDCGAALRWLRRDGRSLGLDTSRIALSGASAGGNLALAAALSPDRGNLAGLVLFYPVCGADFDTGSYRRYAEGFGLTLTRMRELFDLYDPGMRRHSEPRIVPLCAPVADIRAAALPRTAIIAAELDVLADDSRALAGMLDAAGVPHRLHVEPGVTHGFINRGRLIPSADACLDRAAAFLADLS